MKIHIDFGAEDYDSNVTLDFEKDITDAIESMGNCFAIAFFHMLDKLEEERGEGFSEEQVKVISEVIFELAEKRITGTVKQHHEELTETKLYGYMVDAFNELYLEPSGLSKEEFMQRYKDATPDSLTYKIEIANDEICFYLCNENVRDCVYKEDLTDYEMLDSNEQETRCMLVTCIFTVGGDILFGEDNNPMRKPDWLHKKIAGEIEQKLQDMKKSSAKEPKAKLIVAETEIFEKIREIIIEQIGVSESSVTSKAAIADELGVDSLDMAEFIMALEEAFDIEIPDTDIESFKTVGDIEAYIKSKIRGV